MEADDGIRRSLINFRNHLQVMVYVDSELLPFWIILLVPFTCFYYFLSKTCFCCDMICHK